MIYKPDSRFACNLHSFKALKINDYKAFDFTLFTIYSHHTFRKVNRVPYFHRNLIMNKHISLQTYVPKALAVWVKSQADDRKVSVSIVVRDLLVDAWHAQNSAGGKILPLDSQRQNIFISIALDALLAGHPDSSLRKRTLEAYHRKLARLGLTSAPVSGGDDEA